VRHRKEHDPDDQHEFPGGHRAARGKAAGSAGHLAVAGTRRPRSSIPRAAVEARCLGMGRTRARAHPESLRSPATVVSIRARPAVADWTGCAGAGRKALLVPDVLTPSAEAASRTRAGRD
jgi:hypothetical protein